MIMIPRRIVTLVMIFAGLSLACQSSSGPEVALKEYVRAVRDGRCADALEHLSERTRYALEALRVNPQHPSRPLAIEEYYCNVLIYDNCKLGEITVEDRTANSATVSMPCGRTQDGILPGTTGLFLKYEPRSTDLVMENERWRVVEPFVCRLVEVREKEERAREAYIQRQEQFRRDRPTTEQPNPEKR